MSDEASIREIIQYWMEKARESLKSARAEQSAGRLTFAINRSYYACFYSATAVLMSKGKRFKKHTGVRSGVRTILVEEGIVSSSWGKFYNRIFESRQRGDYLGLMKFTMEEVEEAISGSEKFVALMANLIVD